LKIVGDFPPDFGTADLNYGHRTLLFSPWSDFPIFLFRPPTTVESRS
jgi:hypothetical protein